jgi:CubicO group peptidase (beta-lactamase class C family)
LRAHVLEPLGLAHTTVALADAQPAGELAPGHARGARVPNWDHDAYAPMGGLLSSTRELAKFLQAALGGDAAPLAAAFAATTQPQHPAKTEGGSIGLGWFVTPDAKRPVFWHNGQSGGYHSFVGFTRAEGAAAGVVVLTNHAEAIEAIGRGLLRRYPEEIALPAERLAEYAGNYPLAPGLTLALTLEDGVVFLQGTKQPKHRAFASAPDEFFFKTVDASVTFTRDAGGKVTGLVLHQNGRDTPAPRGE